MARINSREEFKGYCLRRLGDGVININVSDEQVEDRIDDAIDYYQLHHYDAVSRTYLKHLITDDDYTNGYIPIDENVMGVVRIFPFSLIMTKSYLFDIQYLMILSDIYNISSTSMLPYTIAMQHLRQIDLLLTGEQPIRFQRHEGRLYIDMNWEIHGPVGSYLIAECFVKLDPETYSSVWNDWFLKRYSTALIKRQWGSNLMKFGNISLPGNIVLNGDKIFAEAEQEIAELEKECQNTYELPPEMIMG